MLKERNGNTRRILMILTAVVTLASLLIAAPASAEDWQAEARRMLQMINDFRTSGEAWYWNKTNTEQVRVTGLQALQYDMELEEVAKVRAAELAVSLSHTRPDGRKWSTAYPAGNYAKAENIAAGFLSAESAFEGFMEEYQPYEKQGHRRIMLQKSLTRVGLAAVEVNGTVYWVQEFASGSVRKAAAASGWTQENGGYCYIRADGSRATGWLEDQGAWYYLDGSGMMQTGWQDISGAWYFFNADGAMQTGWLQKGDDWYYLDGSGAMQTEWQKIDKNWYYFGDDGVMRDDWQKIKGKWYYFADDGEMQTGWQKINGTWYYFSSASGIMQTGWQEINGNWYWFQPGGEMVTGRSTVNGQTEVFDANGVWQYSEIQDYETPLGGPFNLNTLIRLIQHLIRKFISATTV